MKTFYFTFGSDHTHRVNGTTWDCDIVCAIEAETEDQARDKMFDVFGSKWAFSYKEKPDMKFFSRGVKKLEE